jgi:hypothetical protein
VTVKTRHVCLGSNDDDGRLEWIMNEGDVDAAIETMIACVINATMRKKQNML